MAQIQDPKVPGQNIAEVINATRLKPNRLDLVTNPELNAAFLEGQLYGRDPRQEGDRLPKGITEDNPSG